MVAAARAGRADVIVTDNIADFPPGALPAPLIRQPLDEFLLDSLDLYPGQVISAVHAVARRTGRSGPAMTARDIAAYLQARGMPAFGERQDDRHTLITRHALARAIGRQGTRS